MSSFISRLDEYMRYAGLNDNRITKEAGLQIGVINKARKRDSGLSADNIEKILYTYKDINARWLITGEGEMLQNQSENNQDNISFADLINEYRLDIKELNQQIKELEKRNAELEQKLLEAQKHALEEEDVTCANASGFDLAK